MQSPKSTTDPASAVYALYPEIKDMFNEFPKFREEILPSKYWQELNRKNLQQLADSKYDNFKSTLARNYFTWIVNPLNKQIRFLMGEVGVWQSIVIFVAAIFSPRHDLMKRRHTIFYNMLTNLLWVYVKKNDEGGLPDRLSEPREGNPPRVLRRDRLISQHLANSLLEYEAILHPDVDRREVRTILELGPGYGRTAYVFLKLQPGCRYILVDIPPALYVAQSYLSSVFPERKIFKSGPFDDFAEIRRELENANIIFVTPNQLESLPDKSVDLIVNVSSLHEMRMDQIRYFFRRSNASRASTFISNNSRKPPFRLKTRRSKKRTTPSAMTGF
jgi:putative sugar O-methyltransferase